MKKEYYLLPTDNYGQPDGTIEEIELTKKEYEEQKKQGAYIYDDYVVAYCRALD